MNDIKPHTAVSGLGSEQLLDIYRRMVLCRTCDERVWLLNRQGKAAIVASSQGHEAAQIGSVAAMEKAATNSTPTTATWGCSWPSA